MIGVRVFPGFVLPARVLPSARGGPLASVTIVAGFFLRACIGVLLSVTVDGLRPLPSLPDRAASGLNGRSSRRKRIPR